MQICKAVIAYHVFQVVTLDLALMGLRMPISLIWTMPFILNVGLVYSSKNLLFSYYLGAELSKNGAAGECSNINENSVIESANTEKTTTGMGFDPSLLYQLYYWDFGSF